MGMFDDIPDAALDTGFFDAVPDAEPTPSEAIAWGAKTALETTGKVASMLDIAQKGMAAPPDLSGIEISPYERAKLEYPGPIGPYGPPNPEEVISALPGAAKLATALSERRYGGALASIPGAMIDPIRTLAAIPGAVVGGTVVGAGDLLTKPFRRDWGVTAPLPLSEMPAEIYPKPPTFKSPELEAMAKQAPMWDVPSKVAPLALGAANAVSQTVLGMVPPFAPPQAGLQLPFFSGRTGVGRALLGGAGAEQLITLPETVRESIRTLSDKDAGTIAKVEALTRPGVQGLFGRQMLSHAIRNIEGMRPAIRTMDGRILIGEKGETHNEIIERYGLKTEDIDRRAFVDVDKILRSREEAARMTAIPTERQKDNLHSTELTAAQEGIEDARQKQEATTVHGDVRPQPGEGAREVSPERGSARVLAPTEAQETQVLLDPGLAENRRLGLGSDVVIQNHFGTADPNNNFPFRAEPAVLDETGALIRPGRIFVSRDALNEALRDVPEHKRAEYLASAIAEEGVHSLVTNEEALAYSKTLTAAERAAGARMYKGRNVTGQAFTETNLAHELLRQRMQRLLKMTPPEIIDAAKSEVWTRRGLEVIANIIRKVREWVRTKSATSGRRMTDRVLNRMTENLNAAAAEMAYDLASEEPLPAGVEEPFMFRRDPAAERVADEVRDIRFEGVWDPKLPGFTPKWQWTMTVPGRETTFYTEAGASAADVRAKLERKQAEFDAAEGPGSFRRGERAIIENQLEERRQKLAETEEGLKQLKFGLVTDAAAPHRERWIAALEENKRRYQEDIDELVSKLGPAGEEIGMPATFRRARPSKGQQEFFMPPPAAPVPTAERVTALEAGAKPITPFEADKAAYTELTKQTDYLQDLKAAGEKLKAPSFKSFANSMRAKFGPMSTGALFDSWQKSVWLRVSNASGEALGAMRDALNLRAKVGSKPVPDPAPRKGYAPAKIVKLPPGSFPGMVEDVRRERAMSREETQAANKAQQYRRTVQGAVGDALMKQGIEALESEVVKKTIEPQDVGFDRKSINPQYIEISDADRANPRQLENLLTTDAREFRQVVSRTKRVAVLVNRDNGRVAIVSAFKDPRRGAVLLDLDSPQAEHKPVADVMRRWIPVQSIMLSHTVKGFHQKFDSLLDYENSIGSDIRNRSFRAAEGAPPPAEGEIEAPGILATRGTVLPNEARALLDHLYDEVVDVESLQDVKDALTGLADSASRKKLTGREWQAIAAYAKAFDVLEKANDKKPAGERLSPEQLLDNLIGNVYDEVTKAKSGEEFVGQFMERYGKPVGEPVPPVQPGPVAPAIGREVEIAYGPQRPGVTGRVPPTTLRPEQVPPGSIAARVPAPEPTVAKPGEVRPPEMLDEAARRAVYEHAEKMYPDYPLNFVLRRQLIERKVPTERYQMGEKPIKRTAEMEAAERERLAEVEELAGGLPEPEEIKGLTAEGDDVVFGDQLSKAGEIDIDPDAPASFRRNVQYTKEEIKAIGEDIGKWFRTNETSDQMVYILDSMDSLSNNTARQAEMSVRLQSVMKPTKGFRGTLVGRLLSGFEQGKQEILEAAVPFIEAGGVKDNYSIDAAAWTNLRKFKAQLYSARRNAVRLYNMAANIRERRLAMGWFRTTNRMLEGVKYARDHWNDPELQKTAIQAKYHLDIALQRERAYGFDIAQEDHYLPHRYNTELWGSGSIFQLSPHVIGTRYMHSRNFPRYYDAIEHGPYIPVSLDVASLVGHRIRQGMSRIGQREWMKALEQMDVNGRPLAVAAIRLPNGGYQSPNNNYELVQSGKGFPAIAILADYAGFAKRIITPSPIENIPFVRGLLHAEQALKHTLLVGDFFHLARVTYYGAAILRKKMGFDRGWSVLDYAEADIPEAVRRGVISQKDADWANAPVDYTAPGQPTQTITRRILAKKAYSEFGANLGKIQDALYKDLLTDRSPSAGAFRKGVGFVIDPTVGAYNKLLFDRITRGAMTESIVAEYERLHAKVPQVDPDVLLRDIVKDVNNFFGNIGRQGFLKSKLEQDIARMFFLAPQWVEGLARKEFTAMSRLTGASKLLGRKDVPYLGTAGRAMLTGMATMFAVTQALNLIFRGRTTFQNPEEGHKWDAWIPGFGANREGFFLSPLAVYNELTHDVYRLVETKDKSIDAFTQILSNKESPLVRSIMVAMSGISPTGEYQTSSLGHIKTAAEQLLPLPITFGRYIQWAGHQVAPTMIRKPLKGTIQRQAVGTIGLKIEPAKTPSQRVSSLAKDWMKETGLDKETGWKQVMTDEASYSKVRSAVENGDKAQAEKLWNQLSKGRDQNEMLEAMNRWGKLGFTGNKDYERGFVASLSPEDRELYFEALSRKYETLDKFITMFMDFEHPEPKR